MNRTLIHRLPALLLTAVLCAAIVPAARAADTTAAFPHVRSYTDGIFTDVPTEAWYAKSVRDCYEFGLMQGRSATTFAPNGMFSIAEALTVASRVNNLYNGGDGKLPAAQGNWYQSAVDYALSHGIIDAATFTDYEKNITRAEMAEVIRNSLPAECWTALNDVTALPDVSPATAQHEAIFTLYNAGVLGGSGEYGTFHPYAFITRAEVAAILSRCADPSLRLTLSLTPLSQREDIVIAEPTATMSCGLMSWKDPSTWMWGYMDGEGKLAIPASYREAADFVDGYAWVRKSSGWGRIDTNGNVVVPLQYDGYEMLTSDLFMVEKRGVGGRSRYGVIDANGKIIIDCDKYTKLEYSGYFFVGSEGADPGIDVFDLNGTKLVNCEWVRRVSFSNESAIPSNPLIAVEKDRKWALMNTRGPVTEYLYDDITVYDDSSLATLKYGTRQALAGENGIIFDLGVCEVQSVAGNYALIHMLEDDMCYLTNATGELLEGSSYKCPEYGHGEIIDACDGSHVVFKVSYDCRLYDMKTCTCTKLGYDKTKGLWTGEKISEDYQWEYVLYLYEDGSGILIDGERIVSSEEEYTSKSEHFRSFCTEDGKYGMWDCYAIGNYTTYSNWRGKIVVPGVWDTREEAVNACKQYRIIEENGKPIVGYGNPIIGFTPVIRYYKNNMYYDEIRELGEGYYGCRFGKTWYLVHA